MARAVPHVGVAALAFLGLILGIAAAPVLVLTLLPVIAILLPLLFGVLPGERTLERLRARRARPRRRLPASIEPPRLAIVVRRTGRLIAAALAMRPPPARAVFS